MALDPETVKRLEMERKSIARQISENMRIKFFGSLKTPKL